jgi:hypothetical protein
MQGWRILGSRVGSTSNLEIDKPIAPVLVANRRNH